MNIIPSSLSTAAKAYIESSQALNRTIHTAIHQQTDSLREALKEITEQTPNVTNTIPIDEIKLPLSQPRRYFNPKKLEELSRSVKQFGILEPLIVRQKPDGEYELIAGERRLKAALIAGLTEVPVIVHDMDDTTTHTVRLVENLQREDLKPLEETEGILELLAFTLQQSRKYVISLLHRMHNETKGIVSKKVIGNDETLAIQAVFDALGKMTWESFITTRLPLLRLPEDVLSSLREGKIEYTKAMLVARVKDEQQRAELIEKVRSENLSLVQFKELVEQLDNQKLTKEKEVAPHKVLSQRCIDIGKRLSKETKLSSDAKKRKRVEKLLNDLEKLLEDSQTGAVQDNSLQGGQNDPN